MFRYLKEAFWARPMLGSLGAIPWNVLALAGAGMVGVAEHAVWLAAIAAETLYLYVVATNPRFQNWVDAKDVQQIRASEDTSRVKLMQSLAPQAQQRVSKLDEKVSKVEKLYSESQTEDYLFASNREALEKLTTIYLRLLVAQRNITTMASETNESELKQQIATLQAEIGGIPDTSGTLRSSKQATLLLLTQRLRNLQTRDETLAEINSDLTRIEAQIDLALEDASLKGRPTAISANIDLVSHLLDDHDDVQTLATESTTSSSTTQGRQMEN
jgi:hypothetical protein